MKELKYKNQFALSFVLSFFCYGTYLFAHYSQDVYVKAYSDDPGISLNMAFKSGRFTYTMINRILTLLAGTNVPIGLFSSFFTICMFALLIYKSYTIVMQNKRQPVLKEFVCFFAVCLIFLNPLFADWFQFPECIQIYVIGLIGAIYAAAILIDNRYRHSLFISSLLLILATGIYQPVIVYFVLFALIKIWDLGLEHSQNKNVLLIQVKNVCKAIGVYTGASIVQIIIVSIGKKVGQTRVSGNIIDNFKVVKSAQKTLWLGESTGNRSYAYILAAGLAVLYLFFAFWKHRKDKRYLFMKAGICLLFVSAFYFSIFITHIFIEPWISQRTVTCFYAVVPFIVILSVHLSGTDQAGGYAEKGICCVLVCVLSVFIYRTNKLSLDLIRVNQMDKGLSQIVVDYVEEYEQKTGVKVTKMAYCRDDSVSWTYEGIFCGYDLNVRGWAVDWCVQEMVRFYTGRDFQKVKMPVRIYEKYFEGKNWDSFSFEQVQIEGNVVYVCAY